MYLPEVFGYAAKRGNVPSLGDRADLLSNSPPTFTTPAFSYRYCSSRCPASPSLAGEPGRASSADNRSPREGVEGPREEACPSSLR